MWRQAAELRGPGIHGGPAGGPGEEGRARAGAHRAALDGQLALAHEPRGLVYPIPNPYPVCGARRPSYADLAFMEDLLADLERKGVPAPAPIEQRWTASSRSPMSPGD